MTKDLERRRQLIAGLGTTAAAVALGGGVVRAQGPANAIQPARHAQDQWLTSRAAKHGVIIDVTSPGGVAEAIRFAGNIFRGHTTGYNVDEADVAIVMCLRHGATPYAYTDAMWSRHGRVLGRGEDNAAEPPTRNPYNTGDRMQLSELTNRGVRFMVCELASRGIAGRIVGQAGDVDGMLEELEAALIPEARFVAAGVVGVTHAQELRLQLSVRRLDARDSLPSSTSATVAPGVAIERATKAGVGRSLQNSVRSRSSESGRSAAW